jgi:hypothetical protein
MPVFLFINKLICKKNMIRSKICLIILMVTITAVLALLPGCGRENADTIEMISAGTIDAQAGKSAAEKNTDPGEMGGDEEEETGGSAAGEEASRPAQIINISPSEVFEIMENDENYLIIDVRTDEEYGEGHLEGAMLSSYT